MMHTSVKSINKIKEGSRFANVCIYLTCAIIAFITLYPLYYVAILSLSRPEFAITMRVYFLPRGLYFDSYLKIFRDMRLWTSYLNTILYAASEAVLMLFTCSTFAYSLATRQLKGRKFFTTILLIPMYFSGGIIPLFLLIMHMGLYNTVWSLILPGGVSIWYIILMRAYFTTIPEELRESARIDGANHYRTFFNVILPVSKPIIAVIALYTIVGVWNSWFRASIFISNQSIQPLQLYLRRVLVSAELDLVTDLTTAEEVRAAQQNAISNSQLKYTLIVIASLPMLIVYPFFQKYFVKGVMLGSLKG